MRKTLLSIVMLLLAFVTVSAEDAKTLELDEVTPAEGETYFTLSSSGNVTFRFSQEFEFSTAYLVDPKGDKHEISDYNKDDSYYHLLYLHISSLYTKLFQEGAIKEGDNFKVQVEGVKLTADPTVVYGKDGVASVNLKASRLPATWVSSKPENNATINSFYAKDDAEGLFTFTFSEPATAMQAYYAYGDKEAGTYKQVDVPFYSEGNNVVVNMQNIHLEPAAIDGATSIMLRVQGIKSADGQLVDCKVASTPGSLTMNYNIKTVIVNEVTGGFDTQTQNIDEADAINCYVSDTISFDGIKFDYTLRGKAASVTLPASMTTVTKESDGDGAINIAVPVSNFNFDEGDVKVSVVNAKDAYGSAVEIANTFKSKGRKAAKPAMLFSDPAEGIVGNGVSAYTFVFNDSVEYKAGSGYFVMGENQASLERMAMVSVSNNVLTVTRTNTMQALTGKYAIVFEAQTPDGQAYTNGAEDGKVSVNYEYPVNSLVSRAIDPAEGKVDQLKEFVVTFGSDLDPQAQVGGFDSSKKVVIKDAEGKVVAETQNFEFCDDWTQAKFTFAEPVTADGKYTLVIPEGTVFDTKFNDMEEDFGVANGATYNPELTFSYTIGAAAEPTTVEISPAPGEYDTMPETFTLTFSKPVTVETAVIVVSQADREGQSIRRYMSVDGNVVTFALPSGFLASYPKMQLRVVAYDENGTDVTYGDMEGYILADYSAKTTKANTFECSAITPAEGEVSSLKVFTLTFSNPNDPKDVLGGFDTDKKIVLKNDKGEVVANATIEWNAVDWFSADVTLEKEITEKGTYTLEVPEATVYDQNFVFGFPDFGVSSMGAIYNPALSFTYTITGTNGIENISLASDALVKVYSVDGKLLGNGKAANVLPRLAGGVYIVNGKKVIIK